MQKINSSIAYIKSNFTELWLGILLFIALPLIVGIYTDWRGAFATTVINQTIILILFVYKGNK